MIEAISLEKILKRALKNGGDFSEIFEEKSYKTSLRRENHRFDRVAYGQDQGIGFRVVFDGKTAYGFTNQLTEKSLIQLADQLALAIKGKVFSQDICLQKTSRPPFQKIKKSFDQVPLAKKAQILTEADRSVWGMSPSIQQVTLGYREHMRRVRIVNSWGNFSEETQSYLVFSAQVVAAQGEIIQTGYEPMGGMGGFELFSQEKALQIAQIAAKRAISMLSAPLAPSGPMPVVVASEAGGTMVHEAVGHGLEADLAREGLSVYQNRLEEMVANPLITVVDDPTLPGRRGSFCFDDEGTPSQRNVLIEKGVLKNYMYDRLYALKDGVPSTGNGRRESYQHRPIVRMTNTMIAPGVDDPQAILKSVDEGLLVTRMGSGQVNTVNGDFVFEVSEGFRIKNGKKDHPVRGATLTGNGPEILKSIDRVGNDLGFGLGTCGKGGQGVPVGDAQPTLRIPEIIVGGQGSKINQA